METSWKESAEAKAAKERALEVAKENGWPKRAVGVTFSHSESLADFLERAVRFEERFVPRQKKTTWRDSVEAQEAKARVLVVAETNGWSNQTVGGTFGKSKNLEDFLERAVRLEEPAKKVEKKASWKDSLEALKAKERALDVARENGWSVASVGNTFGHSRNLEDFLKKAVKFEEPEQKETTWKDSVEAQAAKARVFEVAAWNGWTDRSVSNTFGKSQNLEDFLKRAVRFEENFVPQQKETTWRDSVEAVAAKTRAVEVAARNGWPNNSVGVTLRRSKNLADFLEKAVRFEAPPQDEDNEFDWLRDELQEWVNSEEERAFEGDSLPEFRWSQRWRTSATLSGLDGEEAWRDHAKTFVNERLTELAYERRLAEVKRSGDGEDVLTFLVELVVEDKFGFPLVLPEEWFTGGYRADTLERLVRKHSRGKRWGHLNEVFDARWWGWFNKWLSELQKEAQVAA